MVEGFVVGGGGGGGGGAGVGDGGGSDGWCRGGVVRCYKLPINT